MTEPVGHAETLEGVDQQPPATGAPKRLVGVVACEISRLRDEVSGTHGWSSGTITFTASGSMQKCSSLAAGRGPPSSS